MAGWLDQLVIMQPLPSLPEAELGNILLEVKGYENGTWGIVMFRSHKCKSQDLDISKFVW